MTERARALIVSGADRYADPWHPFAATSSRVAEVLTGAGFETEIDENVDARLADLAGVDLLVVNVGNTGEAQNEAERAADGATRAGMLAHLNSGGGLLALHVSSTSFPGVPEWESVLGGIWVRGTTMHPPQDAACIHVYPERHVIVGGLADFTVTDERYSYLRTADDTLPLADHEHDGLRHPLLWARADGASRVVYDALGHDVASYDSPEHRTILRRAARWLCRVDDARLDDTDAVAARAAS